MVGGFKRRHQKTQRVSIGIGPISATAFGMGVAWLLGKMRPSIVFALDTRPTSVRRVRSVVVLLAIQRSIGFGSSSAALVAPSLAAVCGFLLVIGKTPIERVMLSATAFSLVVVVVIVVVESKERHRARALAPSLDARETLGLRSRRFGPPPARVGPRRHAEHEPTVRRVADVAAHEHREMGQPPCRSGQRPAIAAGDALASVIKEARAAGDFAGERAKQPRRHAQTRHLGVHDAAQGAAKRVAHRPEMHGANANGKEALGIARHRHEPASHRPPRRFGRLAQREIRLQGSVPGMARGLGRCAKRPPRPVDRMDEAEGEQVRRQAQVGKQRPTVGTAKETDAA